MGKKKRSINREKFGNYGHSKTYRETETDQGISDTELRLLAVENGKLMERQIVLRERKEHGR